jgi:uncharacterized protein (TIGR02217 family)
MARINERISECVSLQFTGGPRYRTLTVPLDNGMQVRNRRWQYPKHEYAAEFLNLRPEDRNEVLRFIHAAAGSWLDFRFKDWMDYEATNEPLSPQIGTTEPVQLVKTYTAGGHSSQRVIQAIVSATVYADGSPVAGTLDTELGLFTPDAPWATARIPGPESSTCGFTSPRTTTRSPRQTLTTGRRRSRWKKAGSFRTMSLNG